MFEKRTFKSENRNDEYLDYLYYRNNSVEKQPLLIYIHGAGSRGNDISKLGHCGPIFEIDNGRKVNATFVAPQCHCDTWFELYDVLIEFIDKMRHDDSIDINRVYLCGVSMGGYASWQVAMSRPEWFAALVPVCGGGMYWNAETLKNVPIWAFHGTLDNEVLPEESIHMVAAVNRAGGNAKLTVYPDTEHNSWEKAFAEDELWKWMFEQKR